MPRAAVVGACGRRSRPVRCGCGVAALPVGCDQIALCEQCRRRAWRRWRRKLTRSLSAHVAAARGAWSREGRRGMMPGAYMITLTVKHSGSLELDHGTLREGWRALCRVASAERWWSAYAMVYEVTEGRDGMGGHVHAHVVVVSRWLPYDRMHDVWRSTTGSSVIDMQAPRGSAKSGAAANYIAKYVTKGVQVTEVTGQKAGELIVFARGKRRVSTSRGFWVRDTDRRPCGVCGVMHRSDGAPMALRRLLPSEYLSALAECRGVWLARGAPQPVLRFSVRGGGGEGKAGRVSSVHAA